MEASTYLAKIAVLLREAPGKMLTFSQIPVVPKFMDRRRKNGRLNYWKLDPSQITEKMVRRHFPGILQLFPELESKVGTDTNGEPEPRSARRAPEPAASRDVQIRCEVKFSGPFSIESLLKRDSPPARASAASPLSTNRLVGGNKSFRWGSEVRPVLFASAGSSSIWTTLHGPPPNRAAQPISGMKMCTRSSLLVCIRDAPYATGPPSHYATFSVPTFTHDARCL
uniref:uncharacterized protein LOC120826688 n=1 Tax=Gasterosteus aculeatus aculeatus TaxID=481459 RepID=UPI001A98C501|nr:uncharacterized protein LOC120826688 [Gasterosteus aculeatus aculeatus]